MFEEELELWIEKYVFGYPAGKTRMKKGLVRMIPSHKVYCEPFCGGASVFFAKEPSETEVLADANAEIVKAFKMIQSLTKAELAELRSCEWMARKKLFERMKTAKPEGKVAKLHRFLYLRSFSFSRLGGATESGRSLSGYDTASEGRATKIVERVAKAIPRLKGVKLVAGDYESVVKEYDGADTVFFFDPPYAGYNVQSGIGEKGFDEERFRKVLKSIKGKFILTYGVKGKLDLSGFKVQRVAQWRSVARGGKGVSRDQNLATLVVTNFKGAVYKAFEETGLDLEDLRLHVDMQPIAKFSDGGMHVHTLDRKRKETDLDGIHSHVFMAESDGGRERILRTVHGGPHVHTLAKEDAESTQAGAKHKHKVLVYSLDQYYTPSEVLETSEESGHTHELGTSNTAFDGGHVHDLVTETGAKIKSLTPGKIATMQVKKSEDPYLEIPTHATPRPAVLKLCASDGGFTVDLWLDNGNRAIGWGFEIARVPVEVGKLAELAKRFTVEGDRYVDSLTKLVPARELGASDLGMLKLEGEIEGGRVEYVDACAFEHGLHTEDSHEYFVSKGAELSGVIDVLRDGFGNWHARIRKNDLLPAVLSPRACLEKWIPPLGHSGLPQALEAVIPESLQFWTEKSDRKHAIEIRDLLVASRLITKDRLALVNGEIRLIEKQISGLFDPGEPTDLDPQWAIKAVAERFGGNVVEKFGTEEAHIEGEALAFYDLTASADSIDSVAKALATGSTDFALMCIDSEQAREALSKYGRPFRIIPSDPHHAAEVCKRIFLTSFPLLKTADVQWLESEELRKASTPIAKPFAGFDTFDDCVASVMAEQDLSEEDARKVCGKLQTEAEKSEETETVDKLFAPYTDQISLLKAEDERYVLGVVLEPETKDSQGDVYSAEEIRKAAHNFMAEFQNVGLMHRRLVNGKVQILESFLAPVAFSVGKEKVKKGTWLLGTRVLDADLWAAVKDRKLTGYSIGGSAIRRPERSS